MGLPLGVEAARRRRRRGSTPRNSTPAAIIRYIETRAEMRFPDLLHQSTSSRSLTLLGTLSVATAKNRAMAEAMPATVAARPGCPSVALETAGGLRIEADVMGSFHFPD